MGNNLATYIEKSNDGIDYDELYCMAQQLRAIWEGWADPLTHLFRKEDFDYMCHWEWKH